MFSHALVYNSKLIRIRLIVLISISSKRVQCLTYSSVVSAPAEVLHPPEPGADAL